ncbi:uncharacterized protein LOC127121597 [Lathyrus oleraceus]|uniref:uncharacterized protein LOC127121597 n=1 Tax=Pisum sativum TaxID=3888 RepID=UPI0021D1B00B|nr:uncharacterized protein LOC127121597 [Pisum sativum]
MGERVTGKSKRYMALKAQLVREKKDKEKWFNNKGREGYNNSNGHNQQEKDVKSVNATQALKDSKWVKAMNDKLESIGVNNTCCRKEIEDFKHDRSKELEMLDLGNLSYFISIEFYKSSRDLMMHQRIYACEIIKRFEMQDCNPASSPVEPRLQLSKDTYEDDVDPTITEDSLDHFDTFVIHGMI